MRCGFAERSEMLLSPRSGVGRRGFAERSEGWPNRRGALLSPGKGSAPPSDRHEIQAEYFDKASPSRRPLWRFLVSVEV
ncbi:MAG: hypothetical protein ACOYW9_02480 [Deinococcota bacterium]